MCAWGGIDSYLPEELCVGVSVYGLAQIYQKSYKHVGVSSKCVCAYVCVFGLGLVNTYQKSCPWSWLHASAVMTLK